MKKKKVRRRGNPIKVHRDRGDHRRDHRVTVSSTTSPPQHPFRLFSPSQVAELFGVSYETVWRWRRDGKLPQPKFNGRWTGAQLASLLRINEADTNSEPDDAR